MYLRDDRQFGPAALGVGRLHPLRTLLQGAGVVHFGVGEVPEEGHRVRYLGYILRFGLALRIDRDVALQCQRGRLGIEGRMHRHVDLAVDVPVQEVAHHPHQMRPELARRSKDMHQPPAHRGQVVVELFELGNGKVEPFLDPAPYQYPRPPLDQVLSHQMQVGAFRVL